MSMYVHAVYFKCKSDADVEALAKNAREMLGQIPTVQKIYCGRRDPGAGRDVNDTDFHVGLVVLLADRAACDAYLEHPIHIEFVQQHRETWSNVRVFDFIAP
jgi:hypothetical protein